MNDLPDVEAYLLRFKQNHGSAIDQPCFKPYRGSRFAGLYTNRPFCGNGMRTCPEGLDNSVSSVPIVSALPCQPISEPFFSNASDWHTSESLALSTISQWIDEASTPVSQLPTLPSLTYVSRKVSGLPNNIGLDVAVETGATSSRLTSHRSNRTVSFIHPIPTLTYGTSRISGLPNDFAVNAAPETGFTTQSVTIHTLKKIVSSIHSRPTISANSSILTPKIAESTPQSRSTGFSFDAKSYSHRAYEQAYSTFTTSLNSHGAESGHGPCATKDSLAKSSLADDVSELSTARSRDETRNLVVLKDKFLKVSPSSGSRSVNVSYTPRAPSRSTLPDVFKTQVVKSSRSIAHPISESYWQRISEQAISSLATTSVYGEGSGQIPRATEGPLARSSSLDDIPEQSKTRSREETRNLVVLKEEFMGVTPSSRSRPRSFSDMSYVPSRSADADISRLQVVKSSRSEAHPTSKPRFTNSDLPAISARMSSSSQIRSSSVQTLRTTKASNNSMLDSNMSNMPPLNPVAVNKILNIPENELVIESQVGTPNKTGASGHRSEPTANIMATSLKTMREQMTATVFRPIRFEVNAVYNSRYTSLPAVPGLDSITRALDSRKTEQTPGIETAALYKLEVLTASRNSSVAIGSSRKPISPEFYEKTRDSPVGTIETVDRLQVSTSATEVKITRHHPACTHLSCNLPASAGVDELLALKDGLQSTTEGHADQIAEISTRSVKVSQDASIFVASPQTTMSNHPNYTSLSSISNQDVSRGDVIAEVSEYFEFAASTSTEALVFSGSGESNPTSSVAGWPISPVIYTSSSKRLLSSTVTTLIFMIIVVFVIC